MDKQSKSSLTNWYAILSITAGLQGIGLLYYLFARAPELRPFQTPWAYHYDAAWLLFVGGSLPSFVHALGLFLIIGFSLTVYRASKITTRTGWGVTLFALIAQECAMGTTTGMDIVVILMALPVAVLALTRLKVANPQYTQSSIHYQKRLAPRLIPAAALTTFYLFGVATSGIGTGYAECARFDNDGRCVERIQFASPIYMSYNDLRSSVRVAGVRPMDDIGRIYVFQNTLYVNERNRGIHVIDNSDPFDPQPLRFIEIPGNLDIEIRGTRLYADSFIDLVTLDISNPEALQEVDRQTDVFAWDENQNIPYNIRLIDEEVDRNLGVVIAYEVSQ